MKKIERDGKTYLSVTELAQTSPQIIEYEGEFYVNIDEPIQEEKPPEKELGDFDQMLGGLMNIPKPD